MAIEVVHDLAAERLDDPLRLVAGEQLGSDLREEPRPLLGLPTSGDVEPDTRHVTVSGGIAEEELGADPVTAAAIRVQGFFSDLQGLLRSEHREIVLAEVGGGLCRP